MLARPALRSAAIASTALAGAALAAAAVRVLPWVFDPAVPWRVTAPFARGLASVAIEAAVLVGWPVGWALAGFRLVESGEARVLQSLGERPARTVARLAPQAAIFALAIASVGLAFGRDANEPGRVVTELLEQARLSCAKAKAPTRYAVPFTDLAWVCAPPQAPDAPRIVRLVGAGPASLSGLLFTATDAHIAGDFRGIDLDDARLLTPTTPAALVKVGHLRVHGLSPWARAATLPAWGRALVFSTAGLFAALLAAAAAVRGTIASRLGAIVVGATGPLAALGVARVLERADAKPLAFALVPLVAAAATLAVSALAPLAAARLARLLRGRHTASKN